MPTESVEPATPAVPDWSVIKEELACPLCEYNLRGLVDPRCPECGYSFTWRDLLDPTQRRHPYLFEHHRKHNIWSFFKTLIGGLRPKRFWTTLNPAQPSHPFRLTIYALVTLSFLFLPTLATIVPSMVETARSNFDDIRRMKLWADKVPAVASGKMTVTQYLAMRRFAPLPPVPPDPQFFIKFFEDRFNSIYSYAMIAAMAVWFFVWPFLTYFALRIFRASMRRAKVQRIHVIRCIVYSFDLGVIISIVSVVLSIAIPLVGAYLGYQNINQWVSWQRRTILVILFVTISYKLCVAYRDYLRFDHAFATVLSAQLIAVLFFMTCAVLVYALGLLPEYVWWT